MVDRPSPLLSYFPMAKKSGFVNVYTGLLAGAVGGWFLHGLTKKPKTTVVGDDTTDYDQGWNAAQVVASYANGNPLDPISPDKDYTTGYRAGWNDYRMKKPYKYSLSVNS